MSRWAPGWLLLGLCAAGRAERVAPYLSLDGSALSWLELTPLACGAAAALGAAVLVGQHLACLRWPALQKQLVRVTLFIPVVCLAGSLSVMYPQLADIFEVLVALYEPVAFHAFWAIMLLYAGGPAKVDQHLRDPHSRLPGPACCRPCRRVPSASRKDPPGLCSYEWRVAQFCLLKPLCSLCVVAVDHAGASRNFALPFTLLALVSTVLAMVTLLVLERRLLHTVLTGLGAFCKFWAIKLIILLIIIQGLVIRMLSELALWDHAPGFAAYQDWTRAYAMARTLQFLLLVEMLLVALPIFWRGYSLGANRHVLERFTEVQSLFSVSVTPGLVLGYLFLGPVDCARFAVLGLCSRHGPPLELPPCDTGTVVEPDAGAADVAVAMLDPERRPSSRKGHLCEAALSLRKDPEESGGVPAEGGQSSSAP